MTSIPYKVFIYLLSAFFLIAVGFDVYHDEITYSIMPFVLVAGIILIQHPVYLLYALIISIPWSVEYHFGENLSTDFPDEPLMLLASGVALIFFIYQRKGINYKSVHPILIIIVLQLIWTIICVFTSTHFLLSVKYLLAKGWYLLSLVFFPLFLFKEARIIGRSSVLLLASMLIATFVALTRQSEYYWSFEKVNVALKPFFHNHIDYSALLVFMVPLLIAIIQLSKSHGTRVFACCLLILSVGALYLAYSRGSWVALIAGLFSYGLLRKRMLLFTFFVFIFLSIGCIFWLKGNERFLKYSNDYKTTIFHPNFKEHLTATYKLKDLSNAERIYRWIAAIDMVPDYWKTGTGPTTFYEQYKSYTVPAFKTYVSGNKEHSTVHNYFLLLLIEQGIVGCLLFIILIASLFWYAQKIYYNASETFWKIVVSGVASILVMECVINFLSDMIETDKVGCIFYLCIATLIMADIKTRKDQLNSTTDIESIS